MDEDHLMAAAHYVALNPVRARLAARTWDWRWSSVRAHVAARDDVVATVAPLLERCNFRFGDPIDTPASDAAMAALRGAETIGRPLGSPAFLNSLAALTGRDARPRKRGSKPGANKGFGKHRNPSCSALINYRPIDVNQTSPPPALYSRRK